MSPTVDTMITKAVKALKSMPIGEWFPKEKVLAEIPENLADEAIAALSSPLAVNDLSKEDRVEMGRTKLFEKLVESKHLEERDDNGVIQVRLSGKIGPESPELSPAKEESANQVQKQVAGKENAPVTPGASKPTHKRGEKKAAGRGKPTAVDNGRDGTNAGHEGGQPNESEKVEGNGAPTTAETNTTNGVDTPNASALGATGLPFHPLLNMIPMMSAEQFKEFVEDIRATGGCDPITVYQGQVIDGRHRDLACKEAGIEPSTVEWNGKGSLLAFLLSKNKHRRHLTPSQQAMVAADLMRKEQEGRFPVAGTRAKMPVGRARDRAAKQAGVSGRSVASADYVQRHGTAEVQNTVQQGRLSVSAAAQIAKLPPEEQNAVVAAGSKAAKNRARELRETSHESPVSEASRDETLRQRVSQQLKVAKALRDDLQRWKDKGDSIDALAAEWPENRYLELLPDLRQLDELWRTLAITAAAQADVIHKVVDRFDGYVQEQLSNASQSAKSPANSTAEVNPEGASANEQKAEAPPARAGRKRSPRRSA